MRKLLDILRCKRGGPEDDKPFSAENMPQNKEQWATLQTQDPILFGNLTQQNVDRLFRENKELAEKNTTLTNQTNNLSVELDSYKTKPPVGTPPVDKPPVPPVDDGVKRDFSVHNLPKDSEQWEELAIDNPNLHADLRFYYNQNKNKGAEDFNSAQRNSRLTVQGEHPDMYLPELDETGQPKKDAEGKVILKMDARFNEPIFDGNSEKGKLWDQIYNEDTSIANNKNAPTLIMSEMERRLRGKAAKVVAEAGGPNPDNQVVQDGVPPPMKVTVKFDSETEKAHVMKQIGRGVYRDEAHYLEEKKKGNEGIYDENRTPEFGIKKQ